MSNKRKIFDVDTKCRLCLGDEGYMSYLFEDTLLPKVQNITKCTSIIIREDDDLPNKVCHLCLYKLDMWNEFKEQFIKSNEVLLAHLDASEINDSTLESNNSKRRYGLQASETETLSENPGTKKVKKINIPVAPLEFTRVEYVTDQSELRDMFIPEDDPITSSFKEEDTTMLDQKSSTPEHDKSEKNNQVESKSQELELHPKPTLVPMRIKHFGGRRGRTTAKRRASTKRWVARKKALLAATGKYASDTDSIISDNDSKLSPVQKARAKTNADKEVVKQRRLAKALKNLETDMKGEYGIKYDSDAILIPQTDSGVNKHKTRYQKKITLEKGSTSDARNVQNSARNENSTETNNEKEEAANEKENSCTLNESRLKEHVLHSQSKTMEGSNDSLTNMLSIFNPQPIKSEIELGNATYIVTSTLVLSEHHYIKSDSKNSSLDGNGTNMDENSQERNTDIIDAVQLRRINPKSIIDNDDKRNVERCLNIEVEGTELEALQKVQAELAAFVEKDMKDRLSHKDVLPCTDEVNSKPKDSFQTLDQQLKAIVEKAIRKNIETSLKLKKTPLSKVTTLHNQKSSTFSPAFIKAATRSKIFQPKVLLMRLDINKVGKRYKINNFPSMESQKSNNSYIEDGNATYNDRQNDSPLQYRTFKLMPVESDDTVNSDDRTVTSTPKEIQNNLNSISVSPKTSEPQRRKLCGPRGRKNFAISDEVLNALRKRHFDDLSNVKQVKKAICETVECDTTTKSLPLQPVTDKLGTKRVKFSTDFENQCNIEEELNQSKYSCDTCKQSFATLHEKEEHTTSHKTVSCIDAVPKPKKRRMMRCKRCHEVVDARLVRIHTCRTAKFHKCYVCNSTFRTEKLLVTHLETHDESEFNIDNIESGESSKNVVNVTSTQGTVAQRAADSNTISIEQCEKEKPATVKEIYTCFVCDKKFTDQEILKDHLQQHCNDESEEDNGSGKEEYQCAICGDSLDNEDALETHVEKHLCDDQDDNPNLINITSESDNKKLEVMFKCEQCTNGFTSEVLLALHMQSHEEELAIAKWEKESAGRSIIREEFLCAICDETFKTEAELSEHVDMHNGNAHVCFLCEKPFLTLEDLQAHVESH
ncbi:uncharacterized protein LOC124184308 isoform X1 [Neodiprion fabricii]|uniref:uncharacterized protein LOC124184308 isoform X1 n=1 Tax=Neodiprion fabricii TaxID=2872261 RepID=UPI001ED9787F|nr:uncharacterized protein LOC124184308 isoform X1 [Neodiprion fabricii]